MPDIDGNGPDSSSQKIISGNFNDLAGLEFRSFDKGTCIISLTVNPMHLNAMEVVHGGVICTLLDTAMARAFFHSQPEGQRKGATLEMKVNFLKTTRDGELTATGQLISSTRRTAYTEGRVVNETGQLIARASATLMLFEPRKPA